MSKWKCPYCGSTNGIEDRSCPGCGCMQQDAPEPTPIAYDDRWVASYQGQLITAESMVALARGEPYPNTPKPKKAIDMDGMPLNPRPIIPPRPTPDTRDIVKGADLEGWVAKVFFGLLYSSVIIYAIYLFVVAAGGWG